MSEGLIGDCTYHTRSVGRPHVPDSSIQGVNELDNCLHGRLQGREHGKPFDSIRFIHIYNYVDMIESC